MKQTGHPVRARYPMSSAKYLFKEAYSCYRREHRRADNALDRAESKFGILSSAYLVRSFAANEARGSLTRAKFPKAYFEAAMDARSGWLDRSDPISWRAHKRLAELRDEREETERGALLKQELAEATSHAAYRHRVSLH